MFLLVVIFLIGLFLFIFVRDVSDVYLVEDIINKVYIDNIIDDISINSVTDISNIVDTTDISDYQDYIEFVEDIEFVENINVKEKYWLYQCFDNFIKLFRKDNNVTFKPVYYTGERVNKDFICNEDKSISVYKEVLKSEVLRLNSLCDYNVKEACEF
jgi:hypothetical protein